MKNKPSNVKKLGKEYKLNSEQIFRIRITSLTGAKKSSKAGETVEPKYQDSMTGKTWIGRGIATTEIKDKNKEYLLFK